MIDSTKLARAMEQAERSIITLDAMLRRDGYTQGAKNMMAELLALVRQVKASTDGHAMWRSVNPVPGSLFYVDGNAVGGVMPAINGWVGFTLSDTNGLFKDEAGARHWVESRCK